MCGYPNTKLSAIRLYVGLKCQYDFFRVLVHQKRVISKSRAVSLYDGLGIIKKAAKSLPLF